MLQKWSPKLREEFFSVASPNTDERYRWFALQNIYNSSTISLAVKALLEHRKFVNEQVTRLKEVANLVNKQIKAARSLKSPLTLPNLLSDKHDLSFEEVYPVRLLSRDDVTKYVKIKGIASFRGQAVCLTGAHAAGKTTTSFAIAENLFLAQSGLLVFGSDFSWNMKLHIGIVVSERGEGSKSELLLEKLGKVVDSLQSVDGKDALLIFDELGTGTQEDAGLELGKAVLSALSKRGMSLLFNTQIQDLAQWSHSEVGATCLYIDNNRVWHPGIKDGGLDKLRKTSGFDAKLKAFRKG